MHARMNKRCHTRTLAHMYAFEHAGMHTPTYKIFNITKLSITPQNYVFIVSNYRRLSTHTNRTQTNEKFYWMNEWIYQYILPNSGWFQNYNNDWKYNSTIHNILNRNRLLWCCNMTLNMNQKSIIVLFMDSSFELLMY